MGREISISRARYLATETEKACASKLPRPTGEIDDIGGPIPWQIKHLPMMIVGGVVAIVLVLATVIGVMVMNANSQDGAASRQVDQSLKLAEKSLEVVEKMVEANREKDLKQAELDKAREAARTRAERRVEKEESGGFWVWMPLLLAAALFVIVSAQFNNLWGAGIALMILGFIVVIGMIPGAAKVVGFVMTGGGG